MEYKTKRKEETSKRVQKESKLAEVNKKRGNDIKHSDKEKKEEADEFSNSFPNFSVLTDEERLAFFDALNTARKNIEKKGLPVRERFGTVHDKYLEYLTNDEKEKEVQKKPENASSARPSSSPIASVKNIQKPSESSKRKANSPKPTSPVVKKVFEVPQKRSVRPESEPNDKYDSIIKGETDKVIHMYLDKKRRIEDKTMSPPVKKLPQPKTTVQKSTFKPPDKESVQTTKKTQKGTNEPKAKTTFRVRENPRFQSLDFTERQEFFRIMREAHDRIVQNNPQKEILSYDEILTPYENDRKETIIVNPVREVHTSKRKNLRVKVTVTSGDNERLSRSKSQILSDCAKEEVSERSKSLESLHNRDMFRAKQSKIPVLKKPLHENDEPDDQGTIKNKQNENKNDAEGITDSKTNQKTLNKETSEKPIKDGTMEKISKEKTRVIMGSKNTNEPPKENKRKIYEYNRSRSAGLVKLKAINLEKKKAEFRRALKEKENRAAEAARREKELLKKKRVEERKKRHQMISSLNRAPSPKKTGNKVAGRLTDYCTGAKKKSKEKCPKESKTKVECVKEIEEPPKVEETKKEDESECLEEKKSPEEDECLEESLPIAEKEESCMFVQQEIKEGEQECLEEETSSAQVFPVDKKEEAEEESLERKTHSVKELQWDDEKHEETQEEPLKKSEQEITKKGEDDFLKEKMEETKKDECERKKSTANAEEEDESERKRSIVNAEEEERIPTSKSSLVSSSDQKIEGSVTVTESGLKSAENEEDSSEESESSFECTCMVPDTQSSEEDATSEDDEDVAFLEQRDPATSPCNEENEQLVEMETHSTKSIARVSFVEQRPEEIKEESKRTLSCTDVKSIHINEKVLDRIRNLISYLEDKVKEKGNFEKDYVRLVLSYTDYLTSVMETLIEEKKSGQRVHSTYAAHEVRLKFKENKDENVEDSRRIPLQRSISDTVLHSNPESKPSSGKRKLSEKSHREESNTDLAILRDSDSSSESEGETRVFIPSTFKKTTIPRTKIRVLQDLLKGRAGFAEGSVEEFKIVSYPEPEFVPKEQHQPTKELTDFDEDHGERVNRMKFLKILANLCKCGKKQQEEDAILENLRGEAVRVDTSDRKKDQVSITINQSTMEVLKAAERKKIIEKYFKID